MPELPEVETMRRGIIGIAGSRIVGVALEPCPRKPIQLRPSLAVIRRRVVGCRVSGVRRVGKRVVLDLDSRDALVFEPRMTGLVLLADPPNQEHLRFRLDLLGGISSRLWFWDRRGLGSIQLLGPRQFADRLGATRIGPDALTITADALRSRLGTGRRAVKVALLDQRAIAGIGNLYASEILHLARLDPRTVCSRLSHPQWNRLQAAIQHVLREAIRYEGSTLSDGTYRNALNESGQYQNHHRVYDRAGQLCATCGDGTVRRIVQAQRATFFCPRCQRRR